MNNRHNVKEYTELSSKAYDSQLLFVEFSKEGAQGEWGTVYLMFENGEVCHLNYMREGYDVLYGLCPVIKEWHVRSEKLDRFYSWSEILDEIVIPPGWASRYMGCWNYLFVNKKVGSAFFDKTASFHNPLDYYTNWFDIATDIIKSMILAQRRLKIKTFWYRLLNIHFPDQSITERKVENSWEISDFIKWEDTNNTRQKRLIFRILSTDNSCDLCVCRLWLQKVDNPHAVLLVCDEGCQLLFKGNVQEESNEDVVVPDDCLNSEIMKIAKEKMKVYIGEHCSRFNYEDIIHDYVRITKRLYDELEDKDCLRDYVWALMTAIDEDDGRMGAYLEELNRVIGYLSSEDLLLKFDCSLLIANKMRDYLSSNQLNLEIAMELIGQYEKSLNLAVSHIPSSSDNACIEKYDNYMRYARLEEYNDYILEEICKIVENYYASCSTEKYDKHIALEKFWDNYFFVGDFDVLTRKMSEIIKPFGDKFLWKRIRQNAYCSGFFTRRDPVEYHTKDYKMIENEANQKVETILDGADKMRLGFCHTYWWVKHRVLRDCYGIWWRSIQDMHPSSCYD